VQENRLYNRGDQQRLIDEALSSEPIKNTFRLGWEFITLNRKFTLTAVVIFILLNILGMIPFIALIFMVLSAVFGVALQIHMGRVLYVSKDIKEYIEEIHDSTLEAILNRYTATAFGAYMGWILMLMLVVILISLVGGTTGLINQNMSEADLLNLLLLLGFPFIIVALLFSYVHPLVESNIIMAEGFTAGLKAVFSIFSIELWRLSFQKSYFKYISIFGVIMLVILFTGAFLIGLFTSLTGLAMLGNILLMLLMYFFMVMMSIGAMMARGIVE
jgi:hypothetical protein